MNKIEALVTDWMQAYVDAHGLELVAVEYRKEQGRWILRVFLDKEGGVSVDDCAEASAWLSRRLDEEDPIPGRYYLEVSSAGIDRPLKKPADYERFAGRTIELRTYAPINGTKNFVGTLVGLEAGAVVLRDQNQQEHRIPLDMVARARLHVEL
mgnify:CR=1 FL=1